MQCKYKYSNKAKGEGYGSAKMAKIDGVGTFDANKIGNISRWCWTYAANRGRETGRKPSKKRDEHHKSNGKKGGEGGEVEWSGGGVWWAANLLVERGHEQGGKSTEKGTKEEARKAEEQEKKERGIMCIKV